VVFVVCAGGLIVVCGVGGCELRWYWCFDGGFYRVRYLFGYLWGVGV